MERKILMEKYSVLITVYQRDVPSFFQESLNSMINQTVSPSEIVIVKDGPLTDELDEVLDQLKDSLTKEINFNIISLDKNVGLARALDIGLNECQYNLVARMDADDISLPERCEKQLKYFDEFPQLDIVGTNIDEFYDSPSNVISSRIVPTEDNEIRRFIKRRSPFNHPSVMYKKQAVQSAGGYGDLKRKQDLDLFSRMINNGSKAANISESLVLFRSNESSFKRRKSWNNCKSYIIAQWRIYRRNECDEIDLIYVVLAQLLIFSVPTWFFKKVLNPMLRK